MNTWESAISVLLVVLAGGLVVGKLTERPRIPDVAAYLLLGILVGPALLGWVAEPGRSEVNQFILNVGATLILFDGGRSTAFSVLRRVWLSIGMLATVGVLVSALVVGAIVHWVFGFPWLYALLLAGVLASTDPATLIPVFKRVPIDPKLQQTVESESAFNDATASVLVFTLVGLAGASHAVNLAIPVWQFIQSAVIGLLVGMALGLLGLWLTSQRGWGVFHEYGSLVMMAIALGAYQGAEILHASGFMAAFAAGVITGNGQAFGWPLAEHTQDNADHFFNAVTMIMRMLIFVLLGTQVDFSVVRGNFLVGVVAVISLMFVARPLSVLASVLVDRGARWGWRDVVFMFWVRETGVIPAALAGMLTAQGLRGADVIGAVTFMAILATILIQATTTGVVARWLGVARPAEEEDI
ncbi:sodium:proton antiporter [Alicyclobacillus sp.]|uniref:cation:proton antiporter n=1 Tax=Alicyclobacillus sp. TaxID=61169 RepID=UPI0025B9E11A|nr:sodium:proton antiporter [Alicyclobacillus sp.]